MLVVVAVPGGPFLSHPAAIAAALPPLDLQNILKDVLIPMAPIPTSTPKLVLKTEKPLYPCIPRPTPGLTPESNNPTKNPTASPPAASST